MMTTDFDKMGDMDLVQHIAFNNHKLAEKDRDFALSMASSVAKYKGATPKQRHWLVRLCERTEGVEKKAETHDIGSLKAIHDMFDAAAQRLQHPVVVLGQGDDAIRLSVASATAKVPGSINVTSTGAYESRTWYGRITSDGKFTTSAKAQVSPAIVAMLKNFAQEPVRVAAAHGRQTGHCCFCARELTDKRSIEVGYGPICADKWSLPWGV